MRTHFNGLTIGVGIALLAVSGIYAPSGFAQAAASKDAPPSTEALPPPTLDDPGTAPAPAAAKHDKRAATDNATPPPLPPESAPLASSAQMDKASMEPVKGELTPIDPTPPKPSITHAAVNPTGTSANDTRLTGEGITVSVRTAPNGDRIEEYRSGGQLTRVKVTPRKAPPYEIIDTNGNGKLDDHDANYNKAQKSVGWTLFKWH
jgi:hypothetical protein